MSYHPERTCDLCGPGSGLFGEDSPSVGPFTETNPFVEIRQPRPSDRFDICCVLAGHASCLHVNVAELLPTEHGGAATPEQWDTWVNKQELYSLG